MENRAVVEAFIDIAQKVFDRFRGDIRAQLQREITVRGFKQHFRAIVGRLFCLHRSGSHQGQCEGKQDGLHIKQAFYGICHFNSTRGFRNGSLG